MANEKIIRMIALILSGIFILIILPWLTYLISHQIDVILTLQNFVMYPINLILGVLFIIIGVFFGAWSNYTLVKKGNGSPVPAKRTKTKKLVTSGPYKYSRNPMIFGTILIWLGLGFILNSFSFTIFSTLILSISLYLVVKFWEEKNLEERFGEDYKHYKNRVSFIIPLPPKN
ncbi:MAG: isoprenylcysteine carboxylmethyltransferase family protein [Promethearchaeota archaeon]|nr:MAG: isoprenylcysteine carboxylmethyltransferase family protein [Candidatus Lokiarchaeota archaeon]